jgi:hypothetical protein
MRPRAGVYSCGIASHLCANTAHRWGTHLMIRTRATRPIGLKDVVDGMAEDIRNFNPTVPHSPIQGTPPPIQPINPMYFIP